MDSRVQRKLEKFFKGFKRVEFKKGEILIQAYDNPRGIFYLKKGLVKMYYISKNGEEVVLNIYKPKSFFPMSWAITNYENLYFYEGLAPIEAYVAPKEESLEFIKQNPDLLFNLIFRVYRGIDGILIKMAYLMSGNAYTRIISEIIIEAKRFGKKKGKTITIEMSEKDLAGETGMTRETISREIKKLKDKKLISFKTKRLVIKNFSLFEAEIS